MHRAFLLERGAPCSSHTNGLVTQVENCARTCRQSFGDCGSLPAPGPTIALVLAFSREAANELIACSTGLIRGQALHNLHNGFGLPKACLYGRIATSPDAHRSPYFHSILTICIPTGVRSQGARQKKWIFSPHELNPFPPGGCSSRPCLVLASRALFASGETDVASAGAGLPTTFLPATSLDALPLHSRHLECRLAWALFSGRKAWREGRYPCATLFTRLAF
ncbi:hypothetical protein VUR80DRAFT_6211 [Thermomyces stellatus]